MIFDPHIFIPIAHAAEEAAAEATKTGIPGTFGIDWMKFVAQIINFAIVLFVLWKWVFKPVTKQLEERTAKIEKSLKDASSTEAEKQEFAAWKQKEISKTKNEAANIISAAQTEATDAKQKILNQTKGEQEKLLSEARAQLDEEKHKILLDAKAKIANIVTTAAEKILRQKLDAPTDKKLIEESLKEISK